MGAQTKPGVVVAAATTVVVAAAAAGPAVASAVNRRWRWRWLMCARRGTITPDTTAVGDDQLHRPAAAATTSSLSSSVNPALATQPVSGLTSVSRLAGAGIHEVQPPILSRGRRGPAVLASRVESRRVAPQWTVQTTL